LNGTPARVAAAERLAKRYVDPLLASRDVLAAISPALSAEEERIAVTYLQLELGNKDPAKGVTKSCVEALVTYVLREASPEALVDRQTVHNTVHHHMPRSGKVRAEQLADAALNRLVRRDLVKHHLKVDAFTLSYPYRQEVGTRIERILGERISLLKESAARVEEIAARLGFDFAYSAEKLASDALRLIEYELSERGRLAAMALAGQGDFFAKRRSLETLAQDLLKNPNIGFMSLDQLGKERFVEIVSAVAEELAQYPTDTLRRRFRTASDAYCLQFALQQTGDVQDALQKVISGTHLLVDTSVIIPCMAERVLPESQRRLTQLLRGATAMGCRLFVGEDVLNEIDTHLDRIRYAYRKRTENGIEGAYYIENIIMRSFLEAQSIGQFGGTFDDFIALFKGRATPRQDLIEYLEQDLSIKFDQMDEELSRIPPQDIVELYDDWYRNKVRRPWIDEKAFETLVLHDVQAFLLVERLRLRDTSNTSIGNRWWWLVLDGNAFRYDRKRQAAGGGRVCMGPDFFARYLSLAPKDPNVPIAARELLPVCLEIASLGFVPPDLRDEAIRLYESTKDMPEYLRRRKLRELVNAAFSAHEKIEDEGDAE
jgi:hypothetical protein